MSVTPTAPKSRAAVSAMADSGVAGPQVLLVDDDRLVLALFSKGLRQAGYRVLVAASAHEALALVRQNSPHIAVLDISMPGVSGLELAARLRERGDVPFLFLSAYSDAETVRQATAAGAVGYLVKPLDTSQLVPAIEAGLARGAEIRRLTQAEAQLSGALQGSRDVSVVIGIVMERCQLDQQAAFQKLRTLARNQRRSLPQVAKDLLDAHAVLGELMR